MSNAPLHPCAGPGCRTLLPRGETRCTSCRTVEGRADRRRRGSAAARGYDADWRVLRAWQLRHQPLCERHLARGEVVAATVANHRRAHKGNESLRLDPGNLESLCKPCHDAIVDEGDFGRTA